MSSPDVSIVIVSWNVRRHLLRCLQTLPSALGTTLSWEAIVVDNASRDGSARAVREQFSGIHVIANTQNRLYTAAANQGLTVAQGRHLLLLNPDTIPKSDSLKRLIDFAELNPSVGLLGPRIVDETDRDDLRTGRHYPTPWSECLDWAGITRRFPKSRFWAANLRPHYDRAHTAAVPLLSGACLLLPEHVSASLRKLDMHYPMYAEDVDLSRRVQQSGYRTVLVGDAIIVHAGGQSSRQNSTHAALLAADGIQRYFRQWHGAKAARRHRLGIACIALVKWLVFIISCILKPHSVYVEDKGLHGKLVRWALCFSPDTMPTLD
ncbi:MAG: glycosyltransferase family 2 protein [Chloroflexi bacterium]|nr:glycosyltransferase family 2 protein [Chloroflexota bacterium]